MSKVPPPPLSLRIPYIDPLPPPRRIIPSSAHTTPGAIAAVAAFLLSSAPRKYTGQRNLASTSPSSSSFGKTVLLTGAGISVASGLADYRGKNGTYTLNRAYRPIYYREFVERDDVRRRYWARSFVGWEGMLRRARPNRAHWAVGRLGEMGVVGRVVTQNVDSFHLVTHPALPTVELHGYLRSLVCLTCRREYPRSTFQDRLAALNPAWAAFLQEMLATGALDTENPVERLNRGIRTNPDGDVDIPDAPYTTFRYPACERCLAMPPAGMPGLKVEADADGAWLPSSTGGILKPAVIMFGESIPVDVKRAAEEAVDEAGRVLVVGSSLATYSAWRLVKRAKERGLPIGIVNLGGVRSEDVFFADVPEGNIGDTAVRCSESAEVLLPAVVKELEKLQNGIVSEAKGSV